MKPKSKVRTEELDSQQLQVPSEADWDQLVRDLKLSQAQAEELRITIIHAIEDLRIRKETLDGVPDRAALVKSLTMMEKTLRKLKEECGTGLNAMAHFLPLEFLASVGKSLTLDAIGEALDKDMYPRRFDLTKAGLDLRAIDQETAHLRQALGLRHGPLLLKAFVDAWHGQVERQLALYRLHKGGRPLHLERKYLLHCLAIAAPGIIGRDAAVSVTGPFIRLCEAVLAACGLSTTGVDKVVPDIVREIRESHDARAKVAP